jgi:sigma-B regulation protein RsbU (phosphoserine phosphatase)
VSDAVPAPRPGAGGIAARKASDFGGVGTGATDERVPALVAEFAATTGLKFRLELRDGEALHVLHDCLVPAEYEGSSVASWPVGEDLELQVRFGATATPADHAHRLLLASLAPALVRQERELLFYSRELANRYGEIDLLTSVTETLGSGMIPERGVSRLLRALGEVMAADCTELWTATDEGARLVRFASSAPSARPASLDLELSRGPLHETFRSESTQSLVSEGGAQLLVPVRPSAAHGLAGALGVLRVRRPAERAFTQADRKLVSAIAGQIGAAFENRRLSDESLERERMLVELELAHDLQLKLLPEVSDFADCADIAARCEPAESVGGDFYHLFRLSGNRIGVMLGDVSSHGYSAGLIMALTMSAASLVVRDRFGPGAVLRGIHQELVRKLESTDMYMTLCYVVLDPSADVLRYANAGHPHAFRIGPETAERLEALNPPLGIAEFDHYEEREVPWRRGSDTLLMFTDGLSETIRADRLWSDDLLVDAIRRNADAPACEIVDGLFAIASAAGTMPVDDRSALVLK